VQEGPQHILEILRAHRRDLDRLLAWHGRRRPGLPRGVEEIEGALWLAMAENPGLDWRRAFRKVLAQEDRSVPLSLREPEGLPASSSHAEPQRPGLESRIQGLLEQIEGSSRTRRRALRSTLFRLLTGGEGFRDLERRTSRLLARWTCSGPDPRTERELRSLLRFLGSLELPPQSRHLPGAIREALRG